MPVSFFVVKIGIMKTVLIKDKEQWEKFLSQCWEKTFLHSWNWGEFQQKLGSKIWRIGLYSEEGPTGAALIVKVEARRGSFLFCPHGPVIREDMQGKKAEALKTLTNYLKTLAKKEKVSFIRISPIWQRNAENRQVFKQTGYRNAPIHIHPENSWVLGLNKTEEDLLAEMRKSTRYLIKKGLKNPDLKVVKSQDIQDMEIFNEIYLATAQKHNFTPFSFDYLKKEFQVFSPDNQVLIFLAYYKQEPIASAVIIFWQNMAYYHQGASLDKYSKLPVSHLLQWEAIREAKKRGCLFYSFWGIAPGEKPNHPWKGITLFKQGFSGKKLEYVKTKDYALSLNYLKNYFVEIVRAKKRGFK